MSKQEYDAYLKFGQGILIEGFKTDGNDMGFLTAQGFADIKVKYETYDDLLFFKNYRNSIYQILPAGNFELNDELQKALVENQGQAQTTNIRILRARAQSERKQFQLNIQNKSKEKVCFGHNVIFKHIDSDSYISGTIKPSNGSNGAFTVQVSDKLSESLVFKLIPYRSFQFLDMPIPFDSPILIKNQFNNGYLTFEKIGMNEQGKNRGTYIEKKPIESNDSYKIPVKTQSKKSDVYEVVTHFVDLSVEKQVPMPWRFKLHVNDVVNDSLIQHDVVFLQHTQNSGVLSTQGKNIILKELKEKNTEQLCFYECLWQIQKHNATKDSYILRHLMSGMILSVHQGDDGRNRAVLTDISDGIEELKEIGYVEIIMAKKEGGIINSESYINIAWKNQILEVASPEEELQESIRKETQEGFRGSEKIDTHRMKLLFTKQIEYFIKPLVFKRSITQEHCFVIMQIEDQLKKDLLFALSFHSVIIKLKEDLQWGAIEAAKKIGYLRMMMVTTKIKQIKKFIKNCSEEDSELEYIMPVYKRQMICKDLGISELLFELLYFMKMNLKEDIFSDKHNERQKFIELYNTLYQVINELIRNNILFKMHVSKWMEFILEDFIANNEECQLNLAKELLKDNQFFVNNFVTKQLIQYLTHSFLVKTSDEQFSEKKYLQIFRLFCLVGTKVNTHNQKLILDGFINILKSTNSIFLIKLTYNDGSIRVSASLDKNNLSEFSFKQFYDHCQKQKPSAWSYFVEYLNLIADLVQGRNKVTQSQLCLDFTEDVVGYLFENEQLNEAQVPIIRLIHYLYAQSAIFYPIEKEKKIMSYLSLEAHEDISILSSIQGITPLLQRILTCLYNKIGQYGPIDPSDMKVNLTLYTLLKFLWETINLGFWSKKEQIKEILNSVLKILQKHESIQDYDSVMIESKQNVLMIKCKIECLNIIELITLIDNDVFVKIIANQFKNFELPKKKFSLKGMFSSSPILQIKCDTQMVKKFISTLPDDEKMQPIVQTNICQQMIEISNYNNAQLTSKAIAIIDRVLQTRKKALHQFSSLILLEGEERLKLLEFMQIHRNKFFILQDPNIIGVDEDNQDCNYFRVYDERDMGLMEVLYLLTELMKNQNTILQLNEIKNIHDSGIFKALGSERLINFTGQRSSTNRMKQQIVYSSNLHQKVLMFIFNCKQLPQSPLALKLLHLSYYFIVSLIQNFNQIKTLMQNYIPKLIHHIKMNVGCIDFLKEMYDNNKTMLYNQITVFELIKEICENIQNEKEDSYYKSKLLDFFRYLIYCNGRSLKNHQIQILKIMQDDSYHNIMIKITPEKIEQLVKIFEEENAGQESTIKMNPELTYIYTFFQIMGCLVDNNNIVNIGKLIKRFPFDLLVNFITKSKSCWPLKRNLRSFINKLYYFRPQIETQLKNIIGIEIYNIIDDLNIYISHKLKKNAYQLENMKFDNPVRFTYIESYHYLLIEEDFFTLLQLVTREKVTGEIVSYLNRFAKEDQQATYNLFKIVERLGCLQNYFTEMRNVYSNSLIKFINSKFKILFGLLQQKSLFIEGLMPDARQQEPNSQKYLKAKDFLINKMIQGRIKQFFISENSIINGNKPLVFSLPNSTKPSKIKKESDKNKLLQVLRYIFKKEKKDFLNKDEEISYNLQQLISSLKLSSVARNYLYEQYLQKVDTYYSRSDRFQYIKRIIAMNTQNSSALSSEKKIFFLQFIIGLVEQANKPKGDEKAIEQQKPSENKQPSEIEAQKSEKPEQDSKKLEDQNSREEAGEQQPESKKDIDEWEPEDWSGNVKEIVKCQKELKKCQLGKLIIQLLKQDIVNDIELANSILLCAISYLLGGNKLTQKDILQQLESDSQNKVFENIQFLIFKLGKLIRKNIDENTAKQQEVISQFNPTTIDNYDYYDMNQKYTLRKNVFEPNSTDQYLYNKLCITTYRRAFKFLQLLCENNNKDGKNFIRKQPDKGKQFNFIDITTKELRNLFQIFCYEIKEVPLFLLDFILEVTQVPIYENQKALMSSTFFEDLCQLKNFFSKDKRFEERSFKSTQHVEAIYYKSISIILSNFEGNDPKTFQTLDTKLQPKFLVEILNDKLKSININTRQDLIKHINNYSNQVTKVDGQDKKNPDFDEDVLIILNIITIFLKMKDALKQVSRINNSYQKFKKQNEQNAKIRIEQELRDEGISNDQIQSKLAERMKDYKCMYVYLQKCLISIEINDDKNQDQTVYFPKYPVFNSLSGNLRDYIMKNVARDSHRDKIVSLLGYTDAVKKKIQYSYNLHKIQKITESNMTDSFDKASKFSILICIYIGIFYHIGIQYQEAQYFSYFPVGAIRFALSLFQLLFTILYVYFWFKLNLWFNPEQVSRTGESEQQQAAEEQAPAEQAPQAENNQQQLPQSNFQLLKEKIMPKYLLVKEWYEFILGELSSQQQKIYFNLQFWRIVFFLGSSIIGTFFYPAIFFLHLIDIFAQVDSLGSILYSIIYSYKNLLYVSIMGVFFTFIFCTVTFSNYMKNVYSGDEPTDQMCGDVFDCVMQLYVSGAIGQTMQKFEIMRFVYDMIYITFFGLLFGNIVSGIMLDAFSSLREEADALDSDKSNKCYICDITREAIEKQGSTFASHIKQHFLWNYIFYVYYLQKIDETDYTGLQYYIKLQYNRPDEEMEVSWIPNKGQSQFDITTEVGMLSEEIKGKKEVTNDKVNELEFSINEFKQLTKDYV